MVGIALEGGGAKGAYQVGAIKALFNNGIKPSMVAGTSIGAINAALIVQGDTSKMVNLWLNTKTDIFGIDSELIEKIKNNKLNLENIKESIENFKQILNNKGIDTTEILKVIEENIDEKKVRKSKIKLGLVTFKVKGFQPLEITIDDIPEGKLSEYLLASCYLPIFSFKKIIDDNYYLDGGVYNNLPISLLEKSGCNKIYTIRLNSIGYFKKKLKKETEVIEIKPKSNLGSMIIFDEESNIKHMKLGYYDTLRVIKNLDGYNYYFYHRPIRYYDKIIRKLDNEVLTRLKKRFRTNNNKALVLKTLEYLMKKYEIDSLRLYNVKKEIRYLKKHNLVQDKLYKSFIDACKLF